MTSRAKNLAAFLGIVCLVFLLHVMATKLSFYYIFWWYDSLLHIIGGMSVAFFGYAVTQKKRGVMIPILALVVGVSWELFERLGHVWWPAYVGFGGAWDTVFDVLCAILGAFIIIAFTSTWQKNNTTHT